MSRAALSVLPCQYYEPRTRVESLAAPPSSGTTKGVQAAPVPGSFIPPPTPAAAAAPKTRPVETRTTLPGGGKVKGVCAAVGAGGEGAASGKVTSPATTTSVTTTGSTVDRVLAVAVSSLSVVLGRDGCGDGTSTAEEGASNATASDAVGAAAGPACVLSGAQLEQAMGLVLAGIYGVVAAARLRWSDVANLRVYYHAPVVAPAAPAAPAAAATTGTTTTGTDTGDSKTMHGTRGGVDEEMVKRATFLALAGATRRGRRLRLYPPAG